MKWLQRLMLAIPVLFVLANYSWVHAAAVYGVSDAVCDAQTSQMARKRVLGLFGEVHSQPWIGCLAQPRWGLGKVIGTTHFAPGLPAVILLNADGQNVDVMAHEWAHAETAARVGVLHRTYQMPTWLDEGLAMQVDLRPSYNLQALQRLVQQAGRVPRLTQISSPRTFFQAGGNGRLHYAYSRCVVADMLRTHSVLDLLQMASLLESNTARCELGQVNSS